MIEIILDIGVAVSARCTPAVRGFQEIIAVGVTCDVKRLPVNPQECFSKLEGVCDVSRLKRTMCA